MLNRKETGMSCERSPYLKSAFYSKCILIFSLILAVVWNIASSIEIKTFREERPALKNKIEKLELLRRNNSQIRKEFARQKAITFSFLELIGRYKGKFTPQQKEECIQIIIITDEKNRHKGLDAPLILAWIEKESRGDPEAISYAGAKGLTQLMDFSADMIFTAMGYPGYDPELVFNPLVSLASGIYYLEDLMKFWKWKGIKNQQLILFYALHSYKWGPGNTKELFNSARRAERPAIEYVNWILNRREFWDERLKYWSEMDE